MEEVVKSILTQQTAILRSMWGQQAALLRSMREQQADLLRSMREQQTAMSEQQTTLLTSINEQLAKLNSSNFLRNKVVDEDLMEEEKPKVTKIEEVTRDSCVQQMQEFPSASWPSSSRSEEKKYRLHIVGEVFHDKIHENGRLKLNVFKGKQLPSIEVILKHGDEQVPATHHLASVRVELVILNANYHIEEFTDWPRKEFEDHLMPVSKTSSTRMTVERGIFSLDAGRKVCTVASIKESSWKQKVRLGVMVHDGCIKERVLEGVSSNEFYVIHERRREATCATKDSKRQATGNSEQNSNGKRVNSHTTLQPRTPYSQWHAQSSQKFGQHGTGEQPSHALNACSTQNFPTAPIDAGYIRGAVPSQSYAPNSDQGFPACVHKKLDDNHGIPFEEGHGDLSSQNPMMFSGHVQSPQKIGQHATGKQPSHAPNACSTQNHPTTPIGNIGGAVPPQAYVPNPNAASVQTLDKPDDNQGHVDPSSRNLMMENGADDKGKAPMSESPGDDEYFNEATFFSLTGDGPLSPLLGMPSLRDCAEMQLREWD